jgi:hypothetical protein
MMNVVGYVPVRRGILDHTHDGRLSTHEFAVLSVLILLADKETGRGTINAPTLITWLRDLSIDAAKRALLHLERKGYIFRDITPYSKPAYPYWVARYVPSTGPHKLLQTEIAKALVSRDPNDIHYVNPALQSAPQGALQTAPQGAHSYKKGKKIREKDNPSTSKDGDVNGDSNSEADGESQSDINGDSGGERKGERDGDSVMIDMDASRLPCGIIRRGGVYYGTNGAILPEEFAERLITLSRELDNG